MIATEEITQTGRYRRVKESRTGDENSAYEAYDAVLETTVMLREMPIRLNKITSLGQQDTLRAAFAEDAKVLTTIRHDSIQRIVDFFSEVDRHCLVMESVNGSDLAELLEKKKYPFPVNDVVNWADQLLEALQFLHTYAPPIFHRDIKPRNLKLTPGGKIKLMGLASTRNPADGYAVSTGADLSYLPLEQIWSGLDAASQKVITNSYDDRSERLLRQPPDARSDIYAVGATLYHLLTGTPPVDALERSIDTLEGKPDPLRSPGDLDAGIPSEISEVLMRAMEVKRENRYDSTVIMRQVLRTALVRVKEREAVEAIEQEEMNAAWETSVAEEKRLEAQRQNEEKIRLEREAEEAGRQAEEQRRLDLEAAETSRRLQEQRRLEEEAEATTRQLEEQMRLDDEAQQANRQLEEQMRLDNDAQQANSQLEEQMRLDHEAAEVQAYEDKRVAEQDSLKIDSEKEHLELEKQISDQKNLELEIEQRRQAELIERQLRDAESERLLAEQRDAEAKKLLLVRELEDFADSETVLPVDDSPRPVSPEPDVLEVPSAAVSPEPAINNPVHEDREMFADRHETGKARWKIPVAVLALVVIGGAFFGIWSFLSAKTASPDPAASNPVLSVAPDKKPDPTVEPSPIGVTETSPDTVPGTESNLNGANPAGQSPAKNKPGTQPQPEVKKPAAAPAKTPAAKKPVTVDDLIKDN